MKKQKLPKLSPEHKEALRILQTYPEFKALEGLFKLEENNIVYQSFKDEYPEPVTQAIRKGWQKGRLYELRKIAKTFEIVRKKK